jgi:hypothetical protein
LDLKFGVFGIYNIDFGKGIFLAYVLVVKTVVEKFYNTGGYVLVFEFYIPVDSE